MLGEVAFRAAGFGRPLGVIQTSGTIVADAGGVVLDVRRALTPFQAFNERELLALIAGVTAAA